MKDCSWPILVFRRSADGCQLRREEPQDSTRDSFPEIPKGANRPFFHSSFSALAGHSLHRQRDQKGEFCVGGFDDAIRRTDGAGYPGGQGFEVHGFAAQVGDDAAIILVDREVGAADRFGFLVVDPAGAAALVVGGAGFAVGVVEPVSGPDFFGALAGGEAPVEGGARFAELPEGLELFPFQFKNEHVKSATRLGALGAMGDDGGDLIGGGRCGKLGGQATAGVVGAHGKTALGSVAEEIVRIIEH